MNYEILASEYGPNVWRARPVEKETNTPLLPVGSGHSKEQAIKACENEISKKGYVYVGSLMCAFLETIGKQIPM